ncbi:MAG: DNA oxidative demethylase AlkB [Pseudomonadota bacterium]
MNLFQSERLGAGALLQRGFASPIAAELLADIDTIAQAAPFRHMVTPGGFTMSVALTNCGDCGWSSDRQGYRYRDDDPLTGQRWPAMPALFRELASNAAQSAGYAGFEPDACLINRYAPGARMSLHQDRDEADFTQPIVSVSLGMSAVFQFGGLSRNSPCAKVLLEHGDVVIWGGADRLRYHGVLALKGPAHPATGEQRINLTFRKAQ